MTSLLFERPLLLIGLLAIVEFILLWLWARQPTARARWAALAGLALAPVLLWVQAMVVTDRERITAVCRKMADAMEAGDVAALGRHVAPLFAVGDVGRTDLLESLTRVLSRIRVEEPRLSDFEVSVERDRARASFQAACRLVTQSAIESGMVSRWELSFREIDARWQVVEIKPLPTPWFPFRSLQELLRAPGG